MEARIEGEAHRFYGLSAMDLRAVGKRSAEWDLNDWKWDGDLFVAKQLNPAGCNGTIGQQFFPSASSIPMNGNSSNSSSSCSDEGNMEIMERRTRDSEKKRRALVNDDDNARDDAGNLTLKLGGHEYPAVENDNWDGNGAKKTKLGGVAPPNRNPNRAVCQVENCGADLSKVKDYHRRHKVCEMHSKASNALVGGIMQRFCQQCSRFHVLQEFDEGKRSCRRRLAGHNKRRRKTNPDTGGNGNPLGDDQTSSFLLISLLKILSNMHSNTSNHAGDEDLLKSLVSHAGEQIGKNIFGLWQGGVQASLNVGNSVIHSEGNGQAPQEDVKYLAVNVSERPQQEAYANGSRGAEAPDGSAKQVKANNFDLNDIYIDSDDGTEDLERSLPMNPTATSSLEYPSWVPQESHQSSPPQTSRNSDSASDQSPSSSNGDVQSRTDRIVIKLFGKEPNDFPVVLRGQILDWLSHSPTDIESYIRPGCVVLTIYLRQAEAAWEELCSDLGFSLRKLLDLSDDPFWTDGWIYMRVLNHIAFSLNGKVVVDASLPLKSRNDSQIFSVRPIAVSGMARARFTVRGINLHQAGTRVLCGVEGTYLVQEEATNELIAENDDHKESNEIVCVNFSCDMPVSSGRGFMEVEDNGPSSSFFPFIVVEDDVCSEIRMLETTLELSGSEAARQEAMDFIHEMGWLLHRCNLKSRLGEFDPNLDLFPLTRFKWLIEFSLDHEWCAVITKLLNLLCGGAVAGLEQGPSSALSELCLLHRAVRKNSRPVVDMLLSYLPEPQSMTGNMSRLFRPDAAGPAGLTPLHIAAGKDGSEAVLDALTEDPGMVGLEAWKNSRDSTGFTPEDYARLRGHFSYIHLIQRKVKKKSGNGEEHVVIEIPVSFPDTNGHQKETWRQTPSSALEISQTNQASSGLPLHCKLCDHKMAYGFGGTRRSLAYRPAMLSMVAIAAVCVCVALLFKSCPEVLYVFQPFRWELLDYGTS